MVGTALATIVLAAPLPLPARAGTQEEAVLADEQLVKNHPVVQAYEVVCDTAPERHLPQEIRFIRAVSPTQSAHPIRLYVAKPRCELQRGAKYSHEELLYRELLFAVHQGSAHPLGNLCDLDSEECSWSIAEPIAISSSHEPAVIVNRHGAGGDGWADYLDVYLLGLSTRSWIHWSLLVNWGGGLGIAAKFVGSGAERFLEMEKEYLGYHYYSEREGEMEAEFSLKTREMAPIIGGLLAKSTEYFVGGFSTVVSSTLAYPGLENDGVGQDVPRGTRVRLFNRMVKDGVPWWQIGVESRGLLWMPESAINLECQSEMSLDSLKFASFNPEKPRRPRWTHEGNGLVCQNEYGVPRKTIPLLDSSLQRHAISPDGNRIMIVEMDLESPASYQLKVLSASSNCEVEWSVNGVEPVFGGPRVGVNRDLTLFLIPHSNSRSASSWAFQVQLYDGSGRAIWNAGQFAEIAELSISDDGQYGQIIHHCLDKNPRSSGLLGFRCTRLDIAKRLAKPSFCSVQCQDSESH